MAGEAAAARITRTIANKGANQAAGQGICLGTIKNTDPLTLAVDGIDVNLLASEIVLSEWFVDALAIGKISGSATLESSGSVNITGSGSVGDSSGDVSIVGTVSGNLNGTVGIVGALLSLSSLLRQGDRVAVAPVGNGMWAILCKVVTIK